MDCAACCVQGKRRAELLDQVLAKFPPCMHVWMLSKWSEPAAWHSARLAFTRTCAVWSMVHILHTPAHLSAVACSSA